MCFCIVGGGGDGEEEAGDDEDEGVETHLRIPADGSFAEGREDA